MARAASGSVPGGAAQAPWPEHLAVLVLRDVTERPEGVAAGTARLVGTHHDTIVAAAAELLADSPTRTHMIQAGNPFGDGQAGQRIAEYLMHPDRRAP